MNQCFLCKTTTPEGGFFVQLYGMLLCYACWMWREKEVRGGSVE